MKITTSPFVLQALLCLAIAPTAFGQTIPGSMLFTPNVNLSAGAQNGYVGYVGGIFLTSYDYYPVVNCLGYFDKDGDGLANSHTVSLWDNSAGNLLLATVTIPAGTSAPLVNGFRWVQLPSNVNMTYNNWYVIDAQVDNVDTWGDLITGGAGQVSFSAQYANLQAGYEFSRAGRYDGVQPPGNQAGSDAIYPAANLGFNIVVPEPTSLAILGLGVALFFGNNTIKRKR
jgi:hypothetical protein